MQATLGNEHYIAVYVASYIARGIVTMTANLSHSEKIPASRGKFAACGRFSLPTTAPSIRHHNRLDRLGDFGSGRFWQRSRRVRTTSPPDLNVLVSIIQ
jgi:hypothetical protein